MCIAKRKASSVYYEQKFCSMVRRFISEHCVTVAVTSCCGAKVFFESGHCGIEMFSALFDRRLKPIDRYFAFVD